MPGTKTEYTELAVAFGILEQDPLDVSTEELLLLEALRKNSFA